MKKIKLTANVTFSAEKVYEISDEQYKELQDFDIPIDEIIDVECSELCREAVQNRHLDSTDFYVMDMYEHTIRDWGEQ